jgi:hypothetical protein
MNWEEYWEIVRDIVLPHLGRLIFTISISTILGIIISIVLLIVYTKKKILFRQNKIYRIIIRVIYIPSIILVCIICAFQIGLATGVYKIVKLENRHIAEGIYSATVEQFFSSNQKKADFVSGAKILNALSQMSNTELSSNIQEYLPQQNNNDKSAAVSSFLLENYKDEAFSIILYALCYASDIRFSEKLGYSDFNQVLDGLAKTDASKIEKSVKFAIGFKFQKFCFKQYKRIILSILLIWIIIICIPLVEYFIYKKWIIGNFLKPNPVDGFSETSALS